MATSSSRKSTAGGAASATTLADFLHQRGPIPERDAVHWVVGVLDALAEVHARGQAHGKLTTSNVFLDEQGRIGLTGWNDAGSSEEAAFEPALDVFSAAALLAELLTGQSVLDGNDPAKAFELALDKPPVFPPDARVEVDSGLRSLITKGLARSMAARGKGDSSLLAMLRQWQAAPVKEPPLSKALQGVFDVLLRKMRQKGDFPALSSTIMRIQSISASENESMASLTNEILKDVALTNKLLRLVNTVHYARGSSINTISRAVSLVGFNGIRNLTLSLVLLEHMQDKAHADLLKQEFLRSLLAASIAREMSAMRGDSEEAFIGAMFQNLGRLLVEYYFPLEAKAVRELMGAEQPLSEAAAAIQVLGMSFEQMGLGMAKAWHLPEIIQRCIRRPVGVPPVAAPSSGEERLRWVAVAANEAADQLLLSDPQETAGNLARISARYARSMGMSSREADRSIVKAREKLNELARVMGIKVTPGSMAAKLLQAPPAPSETPKKTQEEEMVPSVELQATPAEPLAEGATAQPEDLRAADMLLAGVHDVTNAMVEDFKLSDVVRMILETMYRAMKFDNIVFCMRDAKTNTLTGRFGLGHGVENIVKSFRIPLKEPATDLFSAISMKGSDTLISDAKDVRFADRLPSWYHTSVGGSTFLLLPLSLKGKPMGLIYADRKSKGKLTISEKELSLLRTLRSQAVMAFRQSA